MYNNIPQELRDLNQWVLWRYEMVDGRQTKVPYSTKGYKASIQNPTTWASFDEVMKAGPAFQASGIGLVLTANDPYSGIDIDNKPENPASPDEVKVHQKILEAFPSYTERSVGGHGYHIIVRGKVPRGSDRGHVGIYSVDRYLTFTGQVVRDAPILDCQEMLDILYREMQPQQTVELQDAEELLDDREVVDMAMSATNADKFNELCIGNWQAMGYGSQSEADFALLSIIAFYTRNNEQVRRIFRMSNLGKREKAIRDNKYLDFALSKIRAQQPPPIDINQLQANAQAIMEQPTQQQQGYPVLPESTVESTEPSRTPESFPITLPPGLVGELAQYFYRSAIRPVPEIALLSAIGAISGIVGRSYNISQQGLAQYMILLARTGTGKEALGNGINRLYTSVQPKLPMIMDYLGPGVFASGPALHRVLSERPCFVSVLGEFGFTVQRLSNPRANSAEITLKQLLLDAFGKSGYGQVLQPSVYSDREKNINPVASPNLTIIGESTPESFYENLDQGHIASGFLSRFLILEYTGDRPHRNDSFNINPPDDLKQKFADLATVAISMASKGTACQVQMNSDGKRILDEFDLYVDNRIRGANDVLREIWNRCHLKALKLAGLVAVGCNPYKPVVDDAIATWARDLVEKDAVALTARFTSGDIGIGDSKQLADIRRIVESYLKNQLTSSAIKFAELHKSGLIPYSLLLQRTANMSSFRNDKAGSTLALKRSLQAMTDSGELHLVPKERMTREFNFSGDAYGITRHWK